MSGVRETRIRERAYALWQQAGEPGDSSDRFWREAEQAIRDDEAAYDETVDESFPASDPPAHSGIT